MYTKYDFNDMSNMYVWLISRKSFDYFEKKLKLSKYGRLPVVILFSPVNENWPYGEFTVFFYKKTTTPKVPYISQGV